MERWADFQEGLSSDKREYPIQQFRAFWRVANRYAELTRSDALIHRTVAGAVNRLVDFLEVERKRVPDEVLRDAERLECLLFNGYDPHFEGDEPPALWSCITLEWPFHRTSSKAVLGVIGFRLSHRFPDTSRLERSRGCGGRLRRVSVKRQR